MKRLLFLAFAAALVACTPVTDQPVTSTPGGPDTCLRSQIDTMIGERVYDQTITVPDGGIRSLAEGASPDSTSNPTRLNVVIDGEGRILRAFCG